MGWDHGRYYTRSKKVNGRVVREYVGTGRIGELAAEIDAIERQRRESLRQEVRQKRQEIGQIAADIKVIEEATNLLVRTALVAAGFHQHKRGEWRKRREPACKA